MNQNDSEMKHPEFRPFNIEQLKNIPRETVVKLVLLLVLALFLAAVYARTYAKDVSLKDVDTRLVKETDCEKYQVQTARQLYQFLELNAQDYEEVLYRKSTETMSADELLIVKAKSGEDLDAVQDAVEERIRSQISVFEGYGPTQTARLKNALIYKKGRYLFYCVAKNPEKYEEVFRRAL